MLGVGIAAAGLLLEAALSRFCKQDGKMGLNVVENEGFWAAQSNDVRGWVLSLVSGMACGEY